MIVSDTENFVFVHNPKCAGTTVRDRLRKFDTTNNFFWGSSQINGHRVDKAHMPVYILCDAFPKHYDRLLKYFSFSIVRNPYTKVVSAFNETNKDLFEGARSKTPEAVERYRSALNDFILQMNENDVSGWSFDHRHFVRQKDLCFIGHKCVIDIILKIEDWPNCLERLEPFAPKVKTELEAASRRNTRRLPSNPIEYLNAESVKRINDIYKDDFSCFGYAKT